MLDQALSSLLPDFPKDAVASSPEELAKPQETRKDKEQAGSPPPLAPSSEPSEPHSEAKSEASSSKKLASLRSEDSIREEISEHFSEIGESIELSGVGEEPVGQEGAPSSGQEEEVYFSGALQESRPSFGREEDDVVTEMLEKEPAEKTFATQESIIEESINVEGSGILSPNLVPLDVDVNATLEKESSVEMEDFSFDVEEPIAFHRYNFSEETHFGSGISPVRCRFVCSNNIFTVDAAHP